MPGNSVEHFIPQDRSTEEYIYDYFVGQGRDLVARGNPWHTDAAKLQSESKSEYRKYKLKRRISRSNVWVSHMLRSALAQGQYQSMGNFREYR